MKILLSAYACEPDKGSEPDTGWHWAIELQRLGHDVWVITRANNRPAIERKITACGVTNLHFAYHDLPRWASWWKKGSRGVHLYYLLWLWTSYILARTLHQKYRFDVAHHVTLSVFRHVSPLAFLGIPFIFGPVGGGERTPMRLRKSFPLRGFLADLIRDGMNILTLVDPIFRAALNRTSIIYCTTAETLQAMPKSVRAKCQVHTNIGIDIPDQVGRKAGSPRCGLRVLFVGRLLFLKGIHLSLRAFAELHRNLPDSRFTIVGSGPDEKWLKRLAQDLGAVEAVEWISHLPREQVLQLYGEYDVLLFPSLHDSSGNVVLEAFVHGLPVVCLDLGGPALLVDETCGIVVDTSERTEAQVVKGLTSALRRLATDVELRARLAAGAVARGEHHEWKHFVGGIYSSPQLVELGCGTTRPTVAGFNCSDSLEGRWSL